MILFLDANILIYALESHTIWGGPAQTRIATAQAGGAKFMVSDLVRMECLVLPIRLGNATLEAHYHAFFARSDVQVVAITGAVSDRAARIRATHNFKPMDALQLAAAVEHGASIFLTADARLGTFTGVTVEVLS
jgi:predicted nucleic acid-binding protein